VELAPDLPDWVNGDADRLQQILINLLSNASKFTQQGGVTLRASKLSSTAERCTVRFEVIDTGIGIPEEKRKVIFESFQQADNSISRRFGGTGLGLAISLGLVERMGGRLTLESEVGKGSNFSFTAALPIAKPRLVEKSLKQLADATAGAGTVGDASPLSILVVDDVKENQFVIESYLDGSPHVLQFCDDGLAAVNQFKQGRYDLVLMDIQMPLLDGHGATRQIRAWELEENRPPTPVVALSADGLPEHKQQSLNAGCTDHILKPISRAVLLRTVKAYAAAKARSEVAEPPVELAGKD
jgi:CheY-like chemotaxis protein